MQIEANIQCLLCYGAFSGSKLSGKLPQKFNCQINWFFKWWLSVDDFRWRAVLQWNPFAAGSVMTTFQCVLLRIINLRMGCVFGLLLLKSLYILTSKMCWSTIVLIMKTKEAISLKRLWKPLLLLNSPCSEVWFLSPTLNVTTRNDFWVDFRRIKVTWELSIRPTYPTWRGKSLKTPPQCLWITDSISIQNNGLHARSHGVSQDSDTQTPKNSDPQQTQTLWCYLIFVISLMARLGLMSTTEETETFRALFFVREIDWNSYEICRNVLRDSCHGTMTRFNVNWFVHISPWKCHVTVTVYSFKNIKSVRLSNFNNVLKTENSPAIAFSSLKAVFNKRRSYYLADGWIIEVFYKYAAVV